MRGVVAGSLTSTCSTIQSWLIVQLLVKLCWSGKNFRFSIVQDCAFSIIIRTACTLCDAFPGDRKTFIQTINLPLLYLCLSQSYTPPPPPSSIIIDIYHYLHLCASPLVTCSDEGQLSPLMIHLSVPVCVCLVCSCLCLSCLFVSCLCVFPGHDDCSSGSSDTIIMRDTSYSKKRTFRAGDVRILKS